MRFETTTSLLPHQRRAVEKLLPLRVGALFMEMGTGKSRTAIEFIRRRCGKLSKVVWCCPVSLKDTVEQEIRKHTDAEDIFIFDDRVTKRNIPPASWYIVGLESVSSSIRVAVAVEKLIDRRSMVIVDESSYIKGPFSKRSRRLTLFAQRARYRMILTGTPVSQGIVDLYSQLQFLSPEILGYNSFYSFAKNHLEYSQEFPGLIVASHNIPYIAAKIAPYVYQVTKSECLDLPGKLYDQLTFHMTLEQLILYHDTKEEFLDRLENRPDWATGPLIFGMFTALQEIACGFLRKREKGGFKLEEVAHHRLYYLNEAISRNPGKTIIWCKYQYDVEQIGKYLTSEFGADSFGTFCGNVKPADRQREIDKFRGPARFFLATIQCGGHGLTLNEAENVIFYNNGFKYSDRLQAEDRSHRIGQTRRVTYIDLWCSCGVERRIRQAHEVKGDAVEMFRAEVEKIKNSREKLKNLVRSL